jgi:hypothetical protein
VPAWLNDLFKYGGFGAGMLVAVLVIVFAIAKPMREDFLAAAKNQKESNEKTAAKMDELVQENQKTREEFVKFRGDFAEWTRQQFVSRDLFDQRKNDTDRRLAIVEEELRKLRNGK